MAMLFPGMDPYLEEPTLWTGVHASLIIYIRDQLQPLLLPRYWAGVEQRVFVEGPREREIIPDVFLKHYPLRPAKSGTALLEPDAPDLIKIPELEVHESYIAILDRKSGRRVVTVIEVLSPSNKAPGPGREKYLDKQSEVLASETHLVEIDLLRGGEHTVSEPEWAAHAKGPYHYLTCVNRSAQPRNEYELYRRKLNERLSCIRIPLAGDDPDVVLDLQEMLDHVYDAGGYRFEIDYRQPCRPPLATEDQAWADQLLKGADPAVL